MKKKKETKKQRINLQLSISLSTFSSSNTSLTYPWSYHSKDNRQTMGRYRCGQGGPGKHTARTDLFLVGVFFLLYSQYIQYNGNMRSYLMVFKCAKMHQMRTRCAFWRIFAKDFITVTQIEFQFFALIPWCQGASFKYH